MSFLDFIPVVGDVVGGIASVWNNERNVSMQRETNQLNANLAREQMQQQIQMQRENNQFNHDEAELAFQRSSDWNNESAVTARRIAAGLNPAGGSGTPISAQSSPSASSAASGIAPTMTHLDSPRSSFADFNTIADAINKLSQAKLARAEKTNLLQRLKPELDRINSETRRNELLNDFQSIQNDLELMYGYTERNARARSTLKQLENLTEEVLLKRLQGKLVNQQIITEKANSYLTQMRGNLTGEQWREQKQVTASYLSRLNKLFEVQNSEIAANKAQAAKASAEAETENVLRSLKKERAEYENSILFDEKEISNNTVISRTEQVLNDSELSFMIKDQTREKIRKAIKDNDYYELRMLIGTLPFAVAAKILQPSATSIKGFRQ